MNFPRPFLSSLILAGLFLTACTNSTVQTQLPSTDSDIAKALQKGGHIVYLRHTSTEKDYADQVTAEMGNCSTQRVLSEKGWQEAESIGAAFVRLQIPVGKVLSSQYCRAWQTAQLAFGKYEQTDLLNFYPAEDFTPEQMESMRQAALPMMIEIPENGNTLLVGHDDVFESVTGIYPEPQGVAYILKPDGLDFEILGRVGPEEWEQF